MILVQVNLFLLYSRFMLVFFSHRQLVCFCFQTVREHWGEPEQRLSLYILRTFPHITEHVETRPLFSKMMPGIEQVCSAMIKLSFFIPVKTRKVHFSDYPLPCQVGWESFRFCYAEEKKKKKWVEINSVFCIVNLNANEYIFLQLNNLKVDIMAIFNYRAISIFKFYWFLGAFAVMDWYFSITLRSPGTPVWYISKKTSPVSVWRKYLLDFWLWQQLKWDVFYIEKIWFWSDLLLFSNLIFEILSFLIFWFSDQLSINY